MQLVPYSLLSIRNLVALIDTHLQGCLAELERLLLPMPTTTAAASVALLEIQHRQVRIQHLLDESFGWQTLKAVIDDQRRVAEQSLDIPYLGSQAEHTDKLIALITAGMDNAKIYEGQHTCLLRSADARPHLGASRISGELSLTVSPLVDETRNSMERRLQDLQASQMVFKEAILERLLAEQNSLQLRIPDELAPFIGKLPVALAPLADPEPAPAPEPSADDSSNSEGAPAEAPA